MNYCVQHRLKYGEYDVGTQNEVDSEKKHGRSMCWYKKESVAHRKLNVLEQLFLSFVFILCFLFQLEVMRSKVSVSSSKAKKKGMVHRVFAVYF